MTFTVADLPLAVLTVMVTVPLRMPLTTPFLVTVAIFLLLLLQVSVVLAAAGVREGFRVIVLPSLRCSALWLTRFSWGLLVR